jgi:hypothetical protein
MKRGTALPKDVVQSDAPPKVRFHELLPFLDDLVRRAAVQLSALGEDPIAIAASPNRFDDAWNYEWRAVRCGSFFSEKESYMNKYDLDRDIVGAPAAAKVAYSVLEDLEKAQWRDLFAQAYDVEWSDQSLAIVIQDGLSWLVFSSNNCSMGDPAFALWDDGPMSYFGEANERFDWAIQDKRPLVFLSTSFEADALSKADPGQE